MSRCTRRAHVPLPLHLIRKVKEAGFTKSSTRTHEPQPPLLSCVGFRENQKSHMKGVCLAVLTVRKLSLRIRKGIYCHIPHGLELAGGKQSPGLWDRAGWRMEDPGGSVPISPLLCLSHTSDMVISTQHLFSGASLPSLAPHCLSTLTGSFFLILQDLVNGDPEKCVLFGQLSF